MRTGLKFLLLLAALVVVWWAAGLDRRPAEAQSYFTAEEIARANEYQGPKRIAYVLSLLLGLATLWVLAFTGLGERVLGPLARLAWPLAALATPVVVLLIRSLLRAPISYWSGHLHEKAWSFSTQSAAGWLGDWVKALGVSAAVTALIWLGLVWAMRGLPRTWPVAAAIGAAIVSVLLSFLAPLVFEPLFNKFTPLHDRAFAAELQNLAARAGVPVKEVLVADASRRTVKENAYVSGFGASRRLVVYDTLLERAPRPEVVLIVAHELGHRRHRHVEWGTALAAAGSIVAVALVWLLLRSDILPAGARDPGSPRMFPALLLAFAVTSLAIRPAELWLSRTWERQADRFSLELTGDRETYEETERGLATRNLSDLDPNPVEYRFLFTHPAPPERVAMAAGTPGKGPETVEPPESEDPSGSVAE